MKERAAAILDRAVRTTVKEDTDGKTLVNTYQDVEPHIEYAKKCRRVDAEERGKHGKRGDLRRTMSVPINVIMTICAQHKLDFYNSDDAKRIMQILKRDYPAFRTTIDKNI